MAYLGQTQGPLCPNVNFFQGLALSFLICFFFFSCFFLYWFKILFLLKFYAFTKAVLNLVETRQITNTYIHSHKHTNISTYHFLFPSVLWLPQFRSSCITVTQIISLLVNSCFWAGPQSILHTAVRIIFLTCKSQRATLLLQILQ